MTGNTKIPPCGAISVQLNNMLIAPATPEPTMQAGSTCTGSDAANGIAPSVINAQTHDEVGRSCLALFLCKFLLKQHCCQRNRTRRCHTANHNSCHHIVVAGAIAAVPNTYAALLNGPPMSIAIIAASTKPRISYSNHPCCSDHCLTPY